MVGDSGLAPPGAGDPAPAGAIQPPLGPADLVQRLRRSRPQPLAVRDDALPHLQHALGVGAASPGDRSAVPGEQGAVLRILRLSPPAAGDLLPAGEAVR